MAPPFIHRNRVVARIAAYTRSPLQARIDAYTPRRKRHP